jgi:hypothetical protein
MTRPASWRRRSRKQRGIDRRAFKALKAEVAAELHAEYNAKYARRMSTPEGRAARQKWWREYRKRHPAKPLTPEQQAKRNANARRRYALAKATAVTPSIEEQEKLRARWRSSKANQTPNQREAANARRRAKRALLPKKLRPRYDRPFLRLPPP